MIAANETPPNLDLRTAQTDRERELIRQGLNWRSRAEELQAQLGRIALRRISAWWEKPANLAKLAQWMVDEEGADLALVIEMLETPERWVDEWRKLEGPDVDEPEMAGGYPVRR